MTPGDLARAVAPWLAAAATAAAAGATRAASWPVVGLGVAVLTILTLAPRLASPGVAGAPAAQADAASRPVLLLVALALLAILLTQKIPHLLTSIPLLEIGRAASEIALVALAFALVMRAGHVDLSGAGVLVLAAMGFATLSYRLQVPAAAAAAASLIAGAGVGALVGGLVLRARLPSAPLSFAVGMLALLGGRALGAGPIPAAIPPWFKAISHRQWLDALPASILGAALLLALCAPRRARDPGDRAGSPRNTALAFVAAGMLAALAGVLSVSRIGVAHPALASLPFAGVSAALLAGATVRGGVGSAIALGAAALLVGALPYATTSTTATPIAIGAAAVAGVLADRLAPRAP